MSRPVVAMLMLAMLWPGRAGATGPTLADTQKQPAPKLAGQLLSQFAGQVAAARRTSGEAFTPETDQTLAFSTRPKSAGFPGLCSARIVTVRLRYDRPTPRPGDRGQVQDLSLREVYGLVGPTDPLPGIWYDGYAKWLDSACAGLGDGLEFFSASTPAAAWRASRVIAGLAIGSNGKPQPGVAIACAPGDPGCDIPALLAELKPSALADAEESPCNALDPQGQSCLRMTFVTHASSTERRTHLQAVLARPEPYPVELVRALVSAD